MELLSSATLLSAMAVLLGAVVQGTSGIGFALFAAPLVALFHPELVPGPMLILGGSISLLTVLREFRHIDYRAATVAFAGRVPGTLLASLLVGFIPQNVFSTVFAVLILAAIALIYRSGGWRTTPMALGIAGLASGFMGTITSVGTPPLALVMRSMAPAQLRATIGLILTFGSALSILALAVAGRFGLGDLQRSSLLLPALVAGFWISSALKQRLHAQMMRRVVLLLCALSAFGLLVRSMPALALH